MKVYGSDICIDCRNYKAIQKNRGFEAEYVDITENTQNLREFLHFRDNEPIFEPVRLNLPAGVVVSMASFFEINSTCFSVSFSTNSSRSFVFLANRLITFNKIDYDVIIYFL